MGKIKANHIGNQIVKAYVDNISVQVIVQVIAIWFPKGRFKVDDVCSPCVDNDTTRREAKRYALGREIMCAAFYVLWAKYDSHISENKIYPSVTKYIRGVSIHCFDGVMILAIRRFISLTHWGRVTDICVNRVTAIGSDNGLSTGRRQAIIWTNAGI